MAGKIFALDPESLARYRARRKQDLELCRAALAQSDFKAIEVIGHRLRGSAESYGFSELGATGESLELAAQSLDPKTVAACLTAFTAWLEVNG